uniref:Uncharacterized protein n=1 Tax=Timema bartmani TaxID=61472 RepID=A0A7R9EXS3_9NEOP|nr:unnamed protein product [Timema bartmani]
MKIEIVNLHQALENERSAVRVHKRQLNLAVRAAREEEAKRRADSLCDLKLRLEKTHEDALRKQSDALSKTHSIEILAALRKKDAEHRELLSAALRREEDLKVLLRDAERLNLTNRSTSCSQCENFDRLQTERAQLKEHNAEMEARLKLDELRAKERALTQLERENEEQAGRLQLQNEVLEQHKPGHKDVLRAEHIHPKSFLSPHFLLPFLSSFFSLSSLPLPFSPAQRLLALRLTTLASNTAFLGRLLDTTALSS